MAVLVAGEDEYEKWAETVALAQQGNKKMLAVILQAFDGKMRKIAHANAFRDFAEDGEQIERVAVVKALEKWGERQDFANLPAFIVSKLYTAMGTERKRRERYGQMTCAYEVTGGGVGDFTDEVLTADAAQTARSYFDAERRQLEFDEVLEKLELLTPKQEELIELRYLEGWSNGELAQRYGVSPAAISKTIKKGLCRLRELLSDDKDVAAAGVVAPDHVTM